jgi:hypothetical protein
MLRTSEIARTTARFPFPWTLARKRGVVSAHQYMS